jgi:dienelactone hydrolase
VTQARFRLVGAAGVALLIFAFTGPGIGAAARNVSFRTVGGRTVPALLNEAKVSPAPAVVLVPMLGRPKEDWTVIAQWLADANITALAIDLPALTAPDDPKVMAGWSEDVRAALIFLASRPEVRSDRLGVAGASLGANLAAIAAGANEQVRSLALVSPSIDYRGVRSDAAMRQYGARPALLIASRQDYYAARSARELAKNPPGIREIQWSDLGAHGTSLLAREPEMVQALVDWFRRTLG